MPLRHVTIAFPAAANEEGLDDKPFALKDVKIRSLKVYCFPFVSQAKTIHHNLVDPTPISLLRELLCENGNQLVPLFAPNSKQLVSEPRVTVFPFAVIS